MGDAEIADQRAVGAEQDVGGLEVPVHDAPVVQVCQRLGEADPQLGHFCGRQGPGEQAIPVDPRGTSAADQVLDLVASDGQGQTLVWIIPGHNVATEGEPRSGDAVARSSVIGSHPMLSATHQVSSGTVR
ncbi:hypothetical protein QRX50_29020 [Amycolatopsis carbonis]|uniref:Uncharacterized protein n=1 Tax=Amycolatopsis carbonis TaxID=715471 RepID=A0A9Y2IQJ4_9PSEU|nr:hypothetical protein [Amycolatopsis sp. 2-15]WIX84254.1 hypothetical protein QRX50_29020 [Amycolatopsis sp. 2-15]